MGDLERCLWQAWVVAAGLIALAACSRDPPPLTVPFSADLSVSIYGLPESAPPVRVRLGDSTGELPAFPPGVRETSIATKVTQDNPYRIAPPQLTVSYLLPCGWRDIVIPWEAPTDFEERDGLWVIPQWYRDAREGRTDYLEGEGFALEKQYVKVTTERVVIFVDNRGGPDTRLEVGQHTHPVKADSAGDIFVAVPGCNLELSLGKRGIGGISSGQTYLLDISGQRCYLSERVTYVSAGSEPAVPADPRPRYYCSQHLHAVGTVDYWLRNAPETIETYTPFEEHRVQILDIPCEEARDELGNCLDPEAEWRELLEEREADEPPA